jgi:glycosyl transferase family 87
VVLRIAAPIALWLALFIFAIEFVPGLRSRAIRNDFAVYYVSALELRRGIDPYVTDFAHLARQTGLEIREVPKSTEPPTFLLLFEPLTHFPPRTAFWIWQTINFVALAGALALMAGPASSLSGPMAWSLAAFAFIYPPVLSHFWYGQSKLPLLLMLVAMTRLMRRRFDGTAGLILAFAGLVRIYPFAIGGYLVLERRWRALAWMGIGVAVGALATIAIVGHSNCLSFIRGLSFYVTNGQWITNAQGVSKSGDNAPLAFAMRLLRESGFARSGVSGLGEHALLAAIDIVVLGLTVRATLLHPVDHYCDLRLFSLWVVTAIVLPPVSWDYDMTLVLLPFSSIAVAASSGRASRRAIAMAITSYALIGVWRFSEIGDAQDVTGLADNTLKETASLALLAAYFAAYWLVTDGATQQQRL